MTLPTAQPLASRSPLAGPRRVAQVNDDDGGDDDDDEMVVTITAMMMEAMLNMMIAVITLMKVAVTVTMMMAMTKMPAMTMTMTLMMMMVLTMMLTERMLMATTKTANGSLHDRLSKPSGTGLTPDSRSRFLRTRLARNLQRTPRSSGRMRRCL